MGPAFPELVVHRPEQATLEDNLREWVRNSPYLIVALVVHLLVLLVMANMTRELEVDVTRPPITGHLDDPAPPVRDDPLPPKELEEPIDPTFEPVETPSLPTDAPAEPDATSADLDDLAWDRSSTVIGAGAGLRDFGRDSGGGGGPRPTGDGAPMRSEDAVTRALLWLAYHQDFDGHWSAAEFDLQCGGLGAGQVCEGLGSPRYDVGVTGLALLAFLGAGHTDKTGEHAETVSRGLRWLTKVQGPDGMLCEPTNTTGTYDQAIATLALCEAVTHCRTSSARLRGPARRAVAALLAMRPPASGWRYRAGHPEMSLPGRQADTSVTGWALLALASADKAGLDGDPDAWADAMDFLDEVTDPATGRAGYTARGEGVARESGLERTWPPEQSEALTAVALLCRVFDDPELTDPRQRQLVERAADVLEGLPPVWDDEQPGRRDYYGWYYGAYAAYQVGGRTWRVWEDALLDAVVGSQLLEGDEVGSWDPRFDPWGHAGGRVYATALNALTLEVYYRYPRLAGR